MRADATEVLRAPPKRRLLLALPQSLFDLSSGAALSMRLLACQLALAGWCVRAICTTATESGQLGLPPEGPRWPLAQRRLLAPAETAATARWQILDGGVDFELWALPEGTRQSWAQLVGPAFERRVLALLADFDPDVLLTFGAEPRDQRIAADARARGVAVVLALHNLAYLGKPLPEHAALLLPSQFMARRYQGITPQPIGVLPPPMWDTDTRIRSHEAVFFTFFNPELAKGAELIVRLAVALPDLPFLVVAGRAGAADLAAIAVRLGHDPARLENVTVSPGGVPVCEVLALTRAVLVPSLVDEAAGRVAAEALANGIPALVADTGALPETAAPAGQVLALGRDKRGLAIVDDGAVARWCQAVLALAGDAHWQRVHRQACAASAQWHVAVQAAKASAWFETIVEAGVDTRRSPASGD